MMEIPVKLDFRVKFEIRTHCWLNGLEDIAPPLSVGEDMPALYISTLMTVDTRLAYT